MSTKWVAGHEKTEIVMLIHYRFLCTRPLTDVWYMCRSLRHMYHTCVSRNSTGCVVLKNVNQFSQSDGRWTDQASCLARVSMRRLLLSCVSNASRLHTSHLAYAGNRTTNNTHRHHGHPSKSCRVLSNGWHCHHQCPILWVRRKRESLHSKALAKLGEAFASG